MQAQAGKQSVLITHSLLNSWLYMYSDFSNYGDKAEEFSEKAQLDFLNTLRRIRTPTTEAQQKGLDFEDMVTEIASGGGDPADKWYAAAAEIAKEVRGGQFQLKASKKIVVDGIPLVLYGRLDCLKAGRIIDIKFTSSASNYSVGKYFDSPQHPTYFELVPEACDFIYMISDGKKVWREPYLRGEHRPVQDIIHNFFEYLHTKELFHTYLAIWAAKH